MTARLIDLTLNIAAATLIVWAAAHMLGVLG
jgi:hypothetical protein